MDKCKISFAKPMITEEDRRAVDEVLQQSVLTNGPSVERFEQEFASFVGTQCAVAVSSCWAALLLSLSVQGVGSGDEVIVPALTHAAVAQAVELLGAKPIFADCEPDNGNVSTRTISPLVTSRTKVISVVHYLGIPCSTMVEMRHLVDWYALSLVEDCALALGAKVAHRRVGEFADSGCFSFYPSKHVGIGEGGMIVTDHPYLAQWVSRARGFGVERGKYPWCYDVPAWGGNFRMTEVQAVLGLGQLSRLGENLRRRAENFGQLKKLLPSIGLVLDSFAGEFGVESAHYALGLLLSDTDSRERALRALAGAGVEASVYYPKPVPLLDYFKHKYGYQEGQFPNAERIAGCSIALPVGPHLMPGDIEYMVNVLKEVL